MNTVERNVLDRTLNKWATYSKCRVMITSYIFAMILPTAFLIVPSWMHTIKTGEIVKEYNPYIEKIPQRIRDKYGHIRF